MPNRILRDWTDSDRVDRLSAEAEVFFVRLIMKADDYGRFHAETKRVKAACFPLKESIRNTDISRWLMELEAAGLVRCYDAPGGRFMCIERFDQRLRMKKEKFPRPPDDGHMTVICQSSDSHASKSFVSVSDSTSDSDSTSQKAVVGVGGKGFPVTIDDALAQCSLTAVSKDFIMHCYDKSASRGGLDAQKVPIEDFPAYVRTQWKYEQDRLGREKFTQTSAVPRNVGPGRNPDGSVDYSKGF